MKISAILTSRNNVENATQTIQSSIEKCSDKNELEILLAFDDDDNSRFQVMENLKPLQKKADIRFFEWKRVGYFGIAKYLNRMGELATGDLIWLLSDKTVVLTPWWDILMEPYKDKFFLGSHRTTWIDLDGTTYERDAVLFPIISKKWYDVLGKICDHPHMDSDISWTVDSLRKLGQEGCDLCERIVTFIAVHVEHDRRKAAKIDKPGSSDFFSEQCEKSRLEDAKKIFAYLKAHPEIVS